MIRLKELREEKGITQSQLAKEMNTTQGSISQWEIGIAEPNIDYIKKLSEFFDVTSDYLLSLEDESGNINRDYSTGSYKPSVIDFHPDFKNKYARLNKAGRARLETYLDDLLASGNYSAETKKESLA